MLLRRRQVLRAACAAALPTVGCDGQGAPAAVVPAVLDPVVQWLLDTPREELPARALAELAGGLALETLWAADLAACCVSFPHAEHPNLGGPFHAVPAIDVGRKLGDELPEDEALVPTLLALDELKIALAAFADRDDLGPPLPAVDEGRLPASDAAEETLAAALVSYDTELADAAAAALYRARGERVVLDGLRRHAARENHSDGEHRLIHVFHLARLFEVIAPDPIELALRATARAICGPPDGDDPSWALAQQALLEAPSRWDEGEPEQATVEAIWSTLRGGDAAASAEAVVAALARGGAASAWEAVFMASAEVVLRSPESAWFDATHALTGALAARHAYDEAQAAATRLVNLLMAALRVTERYALGGGAFDLASLPGGSGASLDDVFASLARDRVAAAQQLVGYLEGGGELAAFTARARADMLARANNIHDLKYPEAVFQSVPARLAAWRHRFAAASVVFIPHQGEPVSAAYGWIAAAL